MHFFPDYHAEKVTTGDAKDGGDSGIKIWGMNIMSSVQSYFSQPLTRKLAVTQDGNNGVYFYSAADVDTWYNANKSKITKLSDSMYIVPGSTSGSTFEDVLSGGGGATELDYTLPFITDRKTITDMGKEIVFGNLINSRLFVLRKVQSYTQSSVGGSLSSDDTGYVVVENNCSDLQGNLGRFTVRVARV